jgi:hypothetical protein
MSRKHKIVLFAAATLLVAALTVIFFPMKNISRQQRADVLAATTRLPVPTPAAKPGPSALAIGQSLSQAPARPTAQQTGKRRTIPLRFEEFDERILLAPKEIVTLQIDAGVAQSGDSIKIDAPNGGSINGRKAPAIVQPADAERAVQFAVGPSRGLYTLEVCRGRETRIFEFWVDRESPIGQPGPERTFIH